MKARQPLQRALILSTVCTVHSDTQQSQQYLYFHAAALCCLPVSCRAEQCRITRLTAEVEETMFATG